MNFKRLKEKWRLFYLLYIRIPLSVRRLYGPRRVRYAKNELVVFCLVKNGAYYLPYFIQHYLALGVRHIFLLDNGSKDDTVERAKTYPRVSVFQTGLPFREYNFLLRKYGIRRFGKKKRWVLCVDIDELFDYPFSHKVNLASFLEYLRSLSCSALLAYMLDMFSGEPVGKAGRKAPSSLFAQFPWYDISAVQKEDYCAPDPLGLHFPLLSNKLLHPDLQKYLGGIRLSIFGLKRVFLFKHPLIFLDGTLDFVHNHLVSNATVAGVTGVLFHFKFVPGFQNLVKEAVENKTYAGDSYEYRHYLETIEKQPELNLKQPTAHRFENLGELLDNGFLQIDKDYFNWVKKYYE